jgi:hypothetical protein
MFLTSFKALPAICLDRFFIYEVFFLGTARRMDPQMSERNEGTWSEIAAEASIAGESEMVRRDVWPADDDNEFEAETRLGKIRGANGEKATAREAMAIVVCPRVTRVASDVRIARGDVAISR